MHRLRVMIVSCGPLLFTVCGCLAPVRDAPVPRQTAAGSKVTIDPRFLCGEAGSNLPIRPGAARQAVHEMFANFTSNHRRPTPVLEVYDFDYRVLYFFILNVEWGPLGWRWQNSDCSLWIYYDSSADVVRGWKFQPVPPWVGRRAKQLTYAGSVQW